MGSVINRNIVKATATGVIKYYKPSSLNLLQPKINDTWAKSIMERMGLVKRKGWYLVMLIGYYTCLYLNSKVIPLGLLTNVPCVTFDSYEDGKKSSG